MSDPRVRSLEEAETHIASLYARLDAAEKLLSDHAQRLDTAQTVPWKRLGFWIVGGWPLWKDLNAERPRWRPWNAKTRARSPDPGEPGNPSAGGMDE